MPDIENELKHYKDFFKNKVVFCNCDDPFESNFFKYFAMNFNYLGLKKLICTCYAGSPIAQTEFNDLPLFHKDEKLPYMIEITEVPDLNGDGATDLSDIELLLKSDNNVLTALDGDGDFRSEESVELLKEADVVVTNPPFSLFREYIALLMKYNKKFLILGNMNAITYKEVFPLIKNNKIWTGYKHFGGGMNMIMPKSIFDSNKIKKYEEDEHGEIIVNIMGVIWYTNIDTEKRHEELILYRKYSAESYPKYDNYNAIEVSKVVDIPEDYDGFMGVPITFVDSYNPDQFEIKWQASGNTRASAPREILEELGYRQHIEDRGGCSVVNGKRTYGRIIIKKRFKADTRVINTIKEDK